MAGDWIKMRSNLHEDPRVVQLAAALSVDELHAIGMLWRAWAWADSQSLDGNAVRVTEAFLDRITCRSGFADALRKIGWLEGRDGALTFPRFAEHNGQTAKSRALTKDRVGKMRNGASVTTVTHQPLPEKRREEKRREDTKTEAPPVAPALALSGEPAETMKSKAVAVLSDADWLASLAADPAFAGIDVAREHAKAARWCLENRKQLSRRRFVNWLNRTERPMAATTVRDEFGSVRDAGWGREIQIDRSQANSAEPVPFN